MFRTVRLLLIALTLTACVHIEHYPSSWENLSPSANSNDCPLVNGIYDNAGEKPNNFKVYLAVWLQQKNSSTISEEENTTEKLFSAKTVELKLADNNLLSVKAVGDNFTLQWSYDRSKGNFSCKNGVLSIKTNNGINGDNVVAVSSGTIDLYRTEKHVVVNSYGTTAGIMLLFPAAAYGSDWARFAIK